MNFAQVLVEAPQMQSITATTPDEKRKLFARVKSKNWKGVIDKTIACKDGDEVMRIQDAVMYFVGGVCEADIVSEQPLRVNFYSLGYFSNIGS